eukprot:CAMPEP_0176444226 /NCGR_PEP_ID=MMETSP0127-20121128/22930_1 /TAXON_ID=938130 /ORGANISM="Platyophrya macrostoma, Strain WH" /LENGTH=980 /DNA_ID=CAMNT_0017829681 /DNA_START=55 /DNA_END=2997 /DNA_ORIENTATION=-
MEAKLHLFVHEPAAPSFPGSPPAVQVVSEGSVVFRTPQLLSDAGFPVSEVTAQVESCSALQTAQQIAADVGQRFLSHSASDFLTDRRNVVVYAYGPRATPKRQAMFGTSVDVTGGYAFKLLAAVVKQHQQQAVSTGSILTLSCYVLGGSESVQDLVNVSNELGIVVDSVKEGPRIIHVDKQRLQSVTDLQNAMTAVVKNYETVFQAVLPERFATLEEEAMPPYVPDNMILVVHRYDDEESMRNNFEANSIHFIALGDCERPALCGIDAGQLAAYEKAHKTLASVAGVVSAVRCNRLRVPYGKSKLSLLLKRAYNGEKSNPNNAKNAPTTSVLLAHVFNDVAHAEETFHVISMLRRLSSMLGVSGFGSVTRDLAVDKWRLEQDILELKDELTIARAVHDYRPCIFDQPKPVQNIQEERRIGAIQKKRDEARERAQQEIRTKAQDEAKRMIEDIEKQSAMTLSQLEQTLEAKRKENLELQGERAKRVKEYERTLEKIRKRKEEEDVLVANLRTEIATLEEALAERQAVIEKKKKHLELANLDQARGREAILKERETIKAERARIFAERKQQREHWIRQIRELNEKVLHQVRLLAEERKKQVGTAGSAPLPPEDHDETEESVLEDIQTIDKYLPKLISLDDVPSDVDTTDSIRKQLDEYFAQEKATYAEKLQEERTRKEKLERALEVYKARMQETQNTKRKEHLQDALKKEQHLQSLVDQVLQYLQHGLRMTKISSRGNVRRRFFFLSEDCKRIHATELDDCGMPVNRKKPTATVYLKDIKKVVIGMYSPSFASYAGESQLAAARLRAVRDDGTFNQAQTPPITPQNLGLNNYRAFALQLRGGKTLELVCESDSDCEAWLVALKRLLNCKSAFERELERRVAMRDGTSVVSGDALADIQWGANLDIRSLNGLSKLTPEETLLCSEQHIPPALFLRCKSELVERSQSSVVTVYDVRVTSTLDLLRSQALYEHLIDRRLIPPPNI